MLVSHGSYATRGAVQRRARRLRRQILGVSVCAVLLVVYQANRPAEAAARAENDPTRVAERLQHELARTRGELADANQQIERWQRVFGFATSYDIAVDLATDIHDIAVAEGIEPELAFRLVRLESSFDERATSPVGAIGLAQVMLPTARYFQKDITRETLYERETNLRIGFRYLRALVEENNGDVRLALLTYNRGPTAVRLALRNGHDPSNGYDRILMRGYTGTGIIETSLSGSEE